MHANGATCRQGILVLFQQTVFTAIIMYHEQIDYIISNRKSSLSISVPIASQLQDTSGRLHWSTADFFHLLAAIRCTRQRRNGQQAEKQQDGHKNG